MYGITVLETGRDGHGSGKDEHKRLKVTNMNRVKIRDIIEVTNQEKWR